MAPKLLLPGFGKLKAMVRRKQQERRNGKDSNSNSKRNKPPMPTIDVPTTAMRGNSLATVCSSGYFDVNSNSYRSISHEPSLRGAILLPAVPLPSPTPHASTMTTTSSGSGRQVPRHAPKALMYSRAQNHRSMTRTPTPPSRNRTPAANATAATDTSNIPALTVEDAASITSSTTWTDSVTMTSMSPALVSPTMSSSPTTNAISSSNSTFLSTIMASSPPTPPLQVNSSANQRRVHPSSGLSLESTHHVNHKSMSFRLRKRNRALSTKDFDDLLKMESHGWTLDPSLATTHTRSSRHNDRCKNRALGQTDFDRFIFSTIRGGGLRKTNSVGASSSTSTCNSSTADSATLLLAWPKPLVTAQFLRANQKQAAFLRSKSAPVVVIRHSNPATAEDYYPSDAELDRLESIHPFYRHDDDGHCHSPSRQSSRQDGDDALLGCAL